MVSRRCTLGIFLDSARSVIATYASREEGLDFSFFNDFFEHMSFDRFLSLLLVCFDKI